MCDPEALHYELFDFYGGVWVLRKFGALSFRESMGRRLLQVNDIERGVLRSPCRGLSFLAGRPADLEDELLCVPGPVGRDPAEVEEVVLRLSESLLSMTLDVMLLVTRLRTPEEKELATTPAQLPRSVGKGPEMVQMAPL